MKLTQETILQIQLITHLICMNHSCKFNSDLELLHLYVEKQILVNLRHAIMFTMFQQVLVEVQYRCCWIAHDALTKGSQELILVLFGGLSPA